MLPLVVLCENVPVRRICGVMVQFDEQSLGESSNRFLRHEDYYLVHEFSYSVLVEYCLVEGPNSLRTSYLPSARHWQG